MIISFGNVQKELSHDISINIILLSDKEDNLKKKKKVILREAA